MSLCKECGLEVNWTKSGRKWSCANPDGSDHWDLCSQTKFARIKRTGEYFERGKTKGYLTEFKPSGVQLVQESSGRIKGALYQPTGDCAECCAPWEICSRPCPDELRQSFT